MEWQPVTASKPKALSRVWVKTDTGRETTGYLKSDGEWVINCVTIRATGAVVVSWREG